MPNLTVPFVSIESSIYNDIYFKIIDDVADIINIDRDAMRIYHNSMEVGKTDNRDTAKMVREDNTPLMTSKKRLTVTIREEFDEATVGAGTINRRDSFPIFRDAEIGVSIAPIYIVNNIEFSFEYMSPSKVDVDQIRDIIRMHLSRAMSVFTHDVEYTMIIPEFVENFIMDVHENKNRLYPIPLVEYLRGYSTNRLLSITDMSNKGNNLLAIREKQLGVLGEFDFTAVPPDRNSDNSKNQHSFTFSYKVQMEIPKALSISFPIMICNEMMKDKYIDIIEEQTKRELSRKITKHPNVGRSATVMNNLETSTIHERMRDSIYPINIPIYDRFVDSTKVPGYSTIITVLCQVDEEDRKSLFNLRDLGDWEFPQFVLDYIDRNRRKVVKMFEAFLYFGLEQRGKYMASDLLTIDNDLNVKSKVELELIRPVRVSVMSCIDLTYLTEEALKELISDDSVFETFLVEYLELKDSFALDRGKYIEARNNKLYRIIINKLRSLLDSKKYDTVRKYITILGTDGYTATDLGKLIMMGYPEMYHDIIIKGLGFVNNKDQLQPFSLDERERERQVTEMIKHLGSRRRPYLINNVYPDEVQYRHRQGIRQFLQKTVNAYYLVNEKLGEEDGNS